jgi:hypothetical protein
MKNQTSLAAIDFSCESDLARPRARTTRTEHDAWRTVTSATQQPKHHDTRTTSMRQKITCPVSAHLEETEYTKNPTTGRILGVLDCTAAPGTAVDCKMLCAKRLNARLALHKRARCTSDDVPRDDAPTRSGDSIEGKLTRC